MVFTLCIRRSASTLATACRRMSQSQSLTVIATRSSLLHNKPSLLSRNFPYSTATEQLKSDQTLLQRIDSEINDKTVEDADLVEKAEFPFEIEDNPGHRNVTLTREYNGEKIKVDVSMPGLSMDDENEDDDDGNDEKVTGTSIPLVVTVTKKSGLSLEFSCTAYPDEIVIDGLAVNRPEYSNEEQMTYDGPDFQELDENMRKSFHKFLDARGIKASVTDFLYEYMMKKDSREYLLWLKNLKNFIQE